MSASAPAWGGGRVLVTGAGGFIGSHVCEQLVARGAEVRAFVRYNSRNDYGWLESLHPAAYEQIEVFRGDLVNPEAVVRAVEGCDVVIHLGALIPIPYSYVHPREYVAANVTATLNVLEAARRCGTRRVVTTSTSEVYGTARRVPIDEEHGVHAQSPYAATKAGADQLALSYHRALGLPVVVARPFNTYGPRQSARAVIPTIVTQALSGDEVRLGATHPTRDFVYVEDTARGLVACGEAAGVEGEEINLGSGVEISIAALVERIFALLDRHVPVVVADDRLRPPLSEVERLLAATEKAALLLGWRAAVPLDEGLRRTIDWIRATAAAFKPAQYNV